MNEKDPCFVRVIRMSVLFPFEELMFTMKETKVFTPVTLLLFILSINAIKLVDEDIST